VSEALYREAFAVVGYQVTAADALPDEVIAGAERSLGCRAPDALRNFYRLAGGARSILDHYDHFLLPEDWSLEGGKLVFLTENQAVVLYAVDSTVPDEDPPVLMASNQEPYEWHQVCGSCSEFLRVMVHWEGAFGGAMPIVGFASVEQRIRAALAERFRLAGEVNEMWAYGSAGLAICLVQWDDGWRIFVGAQDEDRLAEVDALGVELEMCE
jgi:hypothetical protein